MTPAARAAILAICDAEPDDYDPVRIGIEALCMGDRGEKLEAAAVRLLVAAPVTCSSPAAPP